VLQVRQYSRVEATHSPGSEDQAVEREDHHVLDGARGRRMHPVGLRLGKAGHSWESQEGAWPWVGQDAVCVQARVRACACLC